jgi:hypothetical protein
MPLNDQDKEEEPELVTIILVGSKANADKDDNSWDVDLDNGICMPGAGVNTNFYMHNLQEGDEDDRIEKEINLPGIYPRSRVEIDLEKQMIGATYRIMVDYKVRGYVTVNADTTFTMSKTAEFDVPTRMVAATPFMIHGAYKTYEDPEEGYVHILLEKHGKIVMYRTVRKIKYADVYMEDLTFEEHSTLDYD